VLRDYWNQLYASINWFEADDWRLYRCYRLCDAIDWIISTRNCIQLLFRQFFGNGCWFCLFAHVVSPPVRRYWYQTANPQRFIHMSREAPSLFEWMPSRKMHVGNQPLEQPKAMPGGVCREIVLKDF